MNFFFSFVSPNLSRLELGLTEQVYESIVPKLKHFVAKEWENMCRRCIPMAPVSGIQFDQSFRWWGKNVKGEMMELDIVAESIDRKHLLVGECKWAEVNNPEQLLSQLAKKAQLLPNKKNRTIIPVLFVRSLTKTSSTSSQVFTPVDVLERLR